ncbi:MAG: hypothetical protein AAF613_03815 [Pseudomonadota bacterium]
MDRPVFKVHGTMIVWAANASSQAPIVSDFIINDTSGSGDSDLIAGDVHTVVTGSLSPTQDSFSGATGSMPFVITNTSSGDVITDTSGDGRLSVDDSFEPLGLETLTDARVDTTRQYSSFYVASNTPFSIDAQVLPPGTTLDFILLLITRVQLSATVSGTDGGLSFGSQAQAPHSGGPAAGFSASQRLWDLRTPQTLFTGNQRTAAGAGSIADQSVRINAEYTIQGASLGGYDLSLGTFDFEVEVIYTVYAP